METVISTSWITIGIVGLLGVVLLKLSFKGLNSDLSNEKDSFGVTWSERLGFLSLNAIVLIFAAITAALLKILN